MIPYRTIRLTEYPDLLDIHCEGRRSRIGRFDGRASMTSEAKAKVRRYWKRRDRATAMRQEGVPVGATDG